MVTGVFLCALMRRATLRKDLLYTNNCFFAQNRRREGQVYVCLPCQGWESNHKYLVWLVLDVNLKDRSKQHRKL